MKPYAPPVKTSNRLLKGAALFQLGLALVRLVIERGTWPSISMSIVGALLMIFCAREAVNDERVEHLKLKAAKTGLLFGTLTIMVIYLLSLPWASAFLHPGQGRRVPEIVPLSAFDALILIMAITLGCYYYGRWQDGRDPENQAR